MKQILVIPDRNNAENYMRLIKEYGIGFEYNDFVYPEVLEENDKRKEIVDEYTRWQLPMYCTTHGAFFDVIPFSPDPRVRETAFLRINQSIEAAKAIGAKAVVFHTGYNPFLNSEGYVRNWLNVNAEYWSGVLEKNPELNLYLENTFEATPDIPERLSERLCKYSNYGVCFDYAHAFLSKTAPEEWAKRLGRFIKHVHINDNDGVSDLHLAWGDGEIDRKTFYECYHRYFKGATVLIETSGLERTERSLRLLKEEGFLGE